MPFCQGVITKQSNLKNGGDARNRVTIIFLLKNFATPPRTVVLRPFSSTHSSSSQNENRSFERLHFVCGDARNRTAVHMMFYSDSTRLREFLPRRGFKHCTLKAHKTYSSRVSLAEAIQGGRSIPYLYSGFITSVIVAPEMRTSRRR